MLFVDKKFMRAVLLLGWSEKNVMGFFRPKSNLPLTLFRAFSSVSSVGDSGTGSTGCPMRVGSGSPVDLGFRRSGPEVTLDVWACSSVQQIAGLPPESSVRLSRGWRKLAVRECV